MKRTNIEIHGYGNLAPTPPGLRRDILELFREKPYISERELVVTIVLSETINITCFKQPFFRIFSSDPQAVKEIIRILEENFPALDIEYLKVTEFVPNKKA